MLRFLYIVLALAALPFPSLAATLAGRVVGAHDGDTITVLDASKTQHKIRRLVGIDAPELRQAFGSRSRQNLSGIVFGKKVAIEWDKRDLCLANW